MAYEQLFDQAGRKYNVDPRLLMAQMQVESGGNPNAQSEAGAQGLMQIIPSTQKALGVTQPNDPAQSIDAAARLMAENLDRYGNVADAVRAYHGGTDPANWGPKTQAYVGNVMKGYTGGAPAQQPAAAPDDGLDAYFAAPKAAAPAAPDDGLDAYFAAPKAAAPAAAPQPAAPGATPAAPTPLFGDNVVGRYLENTGRGAIEGVNKTLDAPAEWLARGIDATGLTDYLKNKGIDIGSEADQIAADKARRAAFDASSPGYVGRVSELGGMAAGTLLPMKAAGELATVGGNALLNGLRASETGAAIAPAVAGVGNFLAGGGGVLSRATNMAGQGALGAAQLSGGGQETPVGEQMLTGAALGAAFPLVGSALGGAARYASNIKNAVTQPFSEAGQNAIVNRLVAAEAQKAAPSLANLPPNATAEQVAQVIGSKPASTIGQKAAGAAEGEVGPLQDLVNRAAGGHTMAADATEYVPGSIPTLAQISNNAGIAALERGAISINPSPFIAREQANNNARGVFLNQIRGTPETLAELEAARDAITGPMREQALANAIGPADVRPVIDVAKGILASPAGQQDSVVAAMKKVLSKLELADGKLQTDPAQLYGVRKNINNQLEMVAGKDNSQAQQASRELLQVKQALDQAIEPVAPGFGDYLKTYASMSRPIDAQKFLQAKDLTDATSSGFSLNKTKNLLLQIQRMQSAPGENLAKSITPEQMAGLDALHKDLQRQANSMLGTGKNSATAQLLRSGNLIDNLIGGPVSTGVGAKAVGAGLGTLMGGPGIGTAVGGAIGHQVGESLGQKVATKAPEIESKLFDLLLNNQGGTAGLQNLAPKGGSAESNQLLRRLGVLKKPAPFGGPKSN